MEMGQAENNLTWVSIGHISKSACIFIRQMALLIWKGVTYTVL